MAKGGDRVAFAELFQSRRSSLAKQIQRILAPKAPPHEVEDVLQQTALNACGSIQRLRAQDIRGFHAWLLQVARNCAVSFVRTRIRKGEDARAEEPRPERATDDQPTRRPGGHQPTPSTSEQVRRTVRHLAGLRDEERVSIILRGLQTADWDTVAMLVGHRTCGSVKKLHTRARAKLRDRMARPA